MTRNRDFWTFSVYRNVTILTPSRVPGRKFFSTSF